MRDKPHCQKCNQHHWGFQDCSKGNPPDDLRKPPPGFHVWGHRLKTVEVRADNVLQFPHKARRIGRLTEPPEAA